MLTDAIAIGVGEKEFWELNPHRLRFYIEASKKRQKQKDREMWMMGIYENRAFISALDMVLNGRKARTKYPEKPMLEEYEDRKIIDGTNLSEEEKDFYRMQLAKQLDRMGEQLKAVGRG